MPRISVIMSVYKEPVEWMRQSIDSILNQTYTDFEFIVVNDNPERAENVQLLNEYAQKDERIIIITNEQNIGLTKSLNKGLAIAQGEYIARMDADDISHYNRFAVQIDYLDNHTEVGICGSNFCFFGDVSFFSKKKSSLPVYHDEIVSFMMCKNPIAHPTVMIRRDINGYKFYYDENIKKAQDYKLWYDLHKNGAEFHNLDDILLHYRISTTQITNSANDAQNSTANIVRSGLLDELFHSSSYTKTIHNEIFNVEKTDVPLTEKLAWLKKLMEYNPSNTGGEYLSLLWIYYVKTCLIYSSPSCFFKDIHRIVSNVDIGVLSRMLFSYLRNRN